MKFIDYMGKLNTHLEYLKIINLLEQKTSYIEIVVIDEKDNNELVSMFKKYIILTNKVSKWWGTETKAKNNFYRIKSSKEFFDKLRTYETFCKYYIFSNKEDVFEQTDFGLDDIAFYSDNDELLLCTTTHEGYIDVNEKIFK